MSKLSLVALVATAATVKVTPATNVPADPKLTAGAAPGSQPRWGARYPVIPKPVETPINWAVPSTKTKAGPLGGSNGDSQSFIANSFAEVTPDTNVPANPVLTAGAAPGSQPRWGARYPVIPKPVATPINWAVPSGACKPGGPLGACNGDSQSFIAQSFAEVTPATNVPANPVLTAGAAPGSQPRWGSRYPVIPPKVQTPINWAVPSTKTKAGPLGGSNGDSQSFIANSFAEVTPDTNVPANPVLTAGAAPGSQPRWGARYPVIPKPVATPINWAVPSGACKPGGPLGACNGDSQSFIAQSLAEVTPATNVPADPKLTAGAAPGSQPRWGARYPVIPKPVETPINWAVPSTKTKAGPLGGSNGDSQSFIAHTLAEVTPATNVPADPKLTAGAAPGSQPRWGARYPVIPAKVATPINWAVPSTKTKAGPLGGSNGDSQSFISRQVTPDHPEFKPELTAGAPEGSSPRFGTAYRGYNAVQQRARAVGGVAVRF